MPLTEPAPAKLNLALHVRARRADGYHDLETLFAFATAGDQIIVTPARRWQLTIIGPQSAGLDAESDNLVTRAAQAFATRFGTHANYAVTLDKRLPVASGIGGGSADAAATLRALAKLNGIAPGDPALFEVAAGLGADVPACLLGRSAIGAGRGDRLEPVLGLGGRPALLVNPRVGVSTAAVFAAWDRIDRGPLPLGDAMTVARAGRNDLQPPAQALEPVIAEVLAALAPGAELARMSGSGATCFALYADADARDAAAARIVADRPKWWQLATTID